MLDSPSVSLEFLYNLVAKISYLDKSKDVAMLYPFTLLKLTLIV